MKNPLFESIANATKLTREGDLTGAVTAIQTALRERGGTDVARSAMGVKSERPSAWTASGTRPHTQRADPNPNIIEGSAVDITDTVGKDHAQASSQPCEPAIDFAQNRPQATPSTADKQQPIAEAYTAGAFTHELGALDYKLYVPPLSETGRRPLVLMLHGCTQDPDDFATGTAMNALARDLGVYVLYPAQNPHANGRRCWNWFEPEHQQPDRGEPALLGALTRDIAAKYPINSRQIYVAGLSAGGAMAAVLAQHFPELFAAVGVHSGLAPGTASNLSEALAAMNGVGNLGHDGDSASFTNMPGLSALFDSKRENKNRTDDANMPYKQLVPTIVFHGSADRVVNPRNGERVVTWCTGGAQYANPNVTIENENSPASAGAHGFSRSVHRHPDGRVICEHWVVDGGGHTWFGGDPRGTHVNARGPDASKEMLRFFLSHAG